ncbi:AAA domain [Frankia torreyi]|uniref:AAA domain n=1 Tax=Frankia torreyi TaxID=1856 RepID=A0A0D8BE58_9ACTN|nr:MULTISPECIES: AAA family ATPase [Frankia]KJE22476.1 AAA domain [Frankia torreyi]KQM04514.1 AAA domain [Frankia sp. CpI1-P]
MSGQDQVLLTSARDATPATADRLPPPDRLPDERRLSSLVASGARVQPQLRAIARRLAVFHEQGETSPEIARAGGLAALRALWLEGLVGVEPFRDLLDGEVVDEIGRLALRYLDGRAALFTERQRAGRIRDGHGDLLADDVFCLDDGLRILDGLEFDRRLRVGDVLGDVAFFAMDLERLGQPGAARYFLDAYREFSGETHPASLEHLYLAYRAFVRAKVAGIRDHQGEPGAADAARELAALALRHLRRGRIRLVLVGGLPGTGKSTLSQGLADGADGWVRIGSDAVRKGLAGLAAEQSAADAFGAGLYGPQPTEATYSELVRRARTALERGESVVLDASWTSGAHRRLAAQLATETDADLVELCCVAPPEVAAARIARRAAVGGDASDATIAVHAAMAARNDPWPTAHEVPTTGPAGDALRAACALVA